MSTFCFHLANIEILIIYVDEICGMLGLDTCDDELNPGLLHVASVGVGWALTKYLIISSSSEQADL
jgi:hypothetical protein